jgi:hypothetical protein
VTDLEDAAHAACFHYFNCMNECPKARLAMAKLAQVSGYTDPAVDDEIAELLKADTH